MVLKTHKQPHKEGKTMVPGHSPTPPLSSDFELEKICVKRVSVVDTLLDAVLDEGGTHDDVWEIANDHELASKVANLLIDERIKREEHEE